MSETPPPLRVREDDGSPNVIPTYEMIFSGATLTRRGPTGVLIQVDSGASGSGAPTNSPYVTYSSDSTLSAELILKAGSSVTVVSDATFLYISALTGGGGTTVYAPSGAFYVVLSTDTILANEQVLTPGSGISVTTAGAGGNVIVALNPPTFIGNATWGSGVDSSINWTYDLSANDPFLTFGGNNINLMGHLSISNEAAGTSDSEFAFGANDDNYLSSGASGNTFIRQGAAVNYTFSATSAQFNKSLLVTGTGSFTGVVIGAQATSAGHLVMAGRSISTVAPLAGGANLSADVTLSADTLALVTSGRSITTLFPLSGGADLSANRTFALDTAGFIVNSSRTISTLYPLSGGRNLGIDFNIAVDTAFLVNTGRSISFGSGFLVGGGDLSANRSITYSLPIGVGTGGTGQTTLTAQGLLVGSGASAIYATSGLNAGMLLIGSGIGMNPQIIGSGATGTQLISTAGLAGNVAWVNTGGGSGAPTDSPYLTFNSDTTLSAEKVVIANSSILYLDTAITGKFVMGLSSGITGQYLITSAGIMGSVAWINTAAAGAAASKTVLIPLALMTVQPDSANAFWSSTTGTNVDWAGVTFVDSGEGLATYWGRVPFNVAATPAWNLRLYSKANTVVTGGSVMATVRALSLTDTENIDVAPTIVSSAGLYFIYSANALTINAVSGGTFDSVVAVSAGDLLMVEVNRHGGNSSDTFSNGWNLMGIDMRVDVT